MEQVEIMRYDEILQEGGIGEERDMPPLFYGEVTETRLFDTFPEWKKYREEYVPRPEWVGRLSSVPPADVRVFLGLWCPDCGVLVPRFFKVLDVAGLWGRLPLSLCAVDRAKKRPVDLVNRYRIAYVPTFVFERNGREIGRIVETPSSLYLEEDMWEVLRSDGLG